MLYYLFVFSPAKKKDNHNKKFICFSFRFKRDNACKVTFQSDWKHLWKHIRENDSYQGYCYYFFLSIKPSLFTTNNQVTVYKEMFETEKSYLDNSDLSIWI